jgi:hypothetical protein
MSKIDLTCNHVEVGQDIVGIFGVAESHIGGFDPEDIDMFAQSGFRPAHRTVFGYPVREQLL